jgi:hypothetical protein
MSLARGLGSSLTRRAVSTLLRADGPLSSGTCVMPPGSIWNPLALFSF